MLYKLLIWIWIEGCMSFTNLVAAIHNPNCENSEWFSCSRVVLLLRNAPFLRYFCTYHSTLVCAFSFFNILSFSCYWKLHFLAILFSLLKRIAYNLILLYFMKLVDLWRTRLGKIEREVRSGLRMGLCLWASFILMRIHLEKILKMGDFTWYLKSRCST